MAMALFLGGITVASLFGMPAGSAIGNAFGWRWTFCAVGLCGIFAGGLVWFLLPPDAGDSEKGGSLKAEVQVTYAMQYDLTAQGVKYHLAGTHGPAFVSEDTGNPRTRGAFTLTWNKGPFEVSTTLNYISHYGVTDPSEGMADCGDALSGALHLARSLALPLADVA